MDTLRGTSLGANLGRLRSRDRSDLAAKRCFDRGKSSREKYDTDGAGKERAKRQSEVASEATKEKSETDFENLCHTFFPPSVRSARSFFPVARSKIRRRHRDVIEADPAEEEKAETEPGRKDG